MKRTWWILPVALVAILVYWLLGRGSSEHDAPKNDTAAEPAPAGSNPLAPRPDKHGGDPASLAGSVKTKAGAALAGAWVCATPWDDDLGDDRRDPRCTTSGNDGGWKLDNLFAGHWSVEAGADGKIPARWKSPDDKALALHAGEAKTGIDLALADGGVLVTGTVIDLTGGAIEGALVSMGGGMRGDRAGCVTRSGADGAFRCWVAPGQTWASAVADGYTDGWVDIDAPEAGVALYLTPESTLDGNVVTADTHEPVPGARIDVPGDFGGWSQGHAIADAQGHFHVAHLAPGRYKPTATAPGLYGEAAESVLVGIAQGKEDVTIEVHPAATVHGVVKLDKDPVDDCYVSLAGTGERRYDDTTDDDGTVSFDAVQPGKYKVTISCSHESGHTPYDDVVVADAPLEETWQVDAGNTLKGIVVDAAGGPVARAWVSAHADKDPVWGGASASTEDDGTFSLEGMRPGTVKLEVHAEGHTSPEEPTTVEIGKDHDVRIVLPAGGDLIGKVVTASGAPVPDVDVNAMHGRMSWGGNTSGKTHKDGTFAIKGLTPGDYHVMAMRDWRPLRKPGTTDDDRQGEKVTIAAGASASVTITVEDPSGTITGKVLDASGAPVGDAFLRAERESDAAGAAEGGAAAEARWGWEKKPAVTSTDGSFTIDQLSPGQYTVLAFRKGGSEAKAEHVAVGASVTLTIAKSGSIAGTVSAASGPPPRDVTISVEDPKTGFSRTESFFWSGGAWAIRDLPAGTYSIGAVTSSGKAKLDGIALGEGEDRTGVALTLAATVDVTGRIVDADTKAPIKGVQVFVTPVGGPITIGPGDMEDPDHVTDAEGRFTSHDIAPGKTGLFVMPPFDERDSKYTGTMRHIDVEGTGTVDVGDVELRASRIPKGGEPGDFGFTLKEYGPDVDPADAKLEIASVAKGGPAAAAGLEVGDVIVSVDGHDVTGDHATDYEDLANVTAGTAVTFGLARGATVKITAGPPA